MVAGVAPSSERLSCSTRYLGGGRLCYLRTKGGAEINFIVAFAERLLPIEVKWTDTPTLADAPVSLPA